MLLIKQYSNLINVVKSLYQARRVKTKHEQPFTKSHKKMQQRKDQKTRNIINELVYYVQGLRLGVL